MTSLRIVDLDDVCIRLKGESDGEGRGWVVGMGVIRARAAQLAS